MLQHVANLRVPFLRLSGLLFLAAALLTGSMTFLIVRRMVNQLKQIAVTERRISSIFMDLRLIVREHNRLFPQSGLMLAFWLSIVYLVVWLSAMALSLATDLSNQ